MNHMFKHIVNHHYPIIASYLVNHEIYYEPTIIIHIV